MQNTTDKVSWLAGYYRKFNIFSVIAESLTNLLGKRMRFKWTSDCQNAFTKEKLY